MSCKQELQIRVQNTLSEAVATSLEFGRRIPGSIRRRKACRISYSCMLCAPVEPSASCCARLCAAAARRSAAISGERTEVGGDVDSDMSRTASRAVLHMIVPERQL
jgi:hypothetical protein